MTSKESAQDKELLERYRRASDTEAAAPPNSAPRKYAGSFFVHPAPPPTIPAGK